MEPQTKKPNSALLLLNLPFVLFFGWMLFASGKCVLGQFLFQFNDPMECGGDLVSNLFFAGEALLFLGILFTLIQLIRGKNWASRANVAILGVSILFILCLIGTFFVA